MEYQKNRISKNKISKKWNNKKIISKNKISKKWNIKKME